MSARILIVDDNPTNMKLAADVLGSAGCAVRKAGDAEEAQVFLANELPDLILMDIALPGMDGLSLTRKLKADERFRRIPIVALTASAMKGDDKKALAAGCQGYITKPIDTRRFAQQVLAFLPFDTPITGSREHERAMPVRNTPMTVLVVDDSAGNRKLLRANLEHEGYGVLEAANGREALEVLDRERADAVISDILMPLMDGYRLCREIRASSRPYATLPLVLCTATYDSPRDRELAEAVGADDYLVRPAPIAVIVRAIQEARKKARTPAQQAVSSLEEVDVLQQYNAALVRKLEERNAQLQNALAELQASQLKLVELNRYLELRVEQRTAAFDAANKEIESFSYSVAHDLRAPLRHIVGFADLLRESAAERLTGEDHVFVDKIMSAATRMDQLITDLLSFAQAARTELTIGPVNLEDVLDDALGTLHSEIRGREIQWKREPLPEVRGDASLLCQVYVNLISNAIKYTRPRSPAIIEIGYRAGRSQEVVLYVRDNGVGFDMSRGKQLFGVFQRLHSASEFEGTGIGLANVQRIVARHGGRVWAEAAVDRGAAFFFTLPPANAPRAGA